MKLMNKVKKYIKATPKERKEYFSRVVNRIYIKLLPFFRIFRFPLASSKEKKNLILDLTERVTNLGKHIRYRYYLDFKLFYSCSKNGTGIVNHVMCDRIYEKETCTFLEESLKNIDNPTFIDVGANIGLISLYMLKKVPNLKVYAFEPSPHQHMLFAKTIEENKISDKIQLFDLAASDKEDKILFFVHNEANCSGDGFHDTGRGGAGNSINVKTMPLDIWWKNNGQQKIDLIKVDTEGAELLVFKGAEEMILACSPVIFFEMQEVNYKVYNYSWKDMLSFFESVGYSIYTELEEKFEADNAEELMKNNYNYIAKKSDK